MAVWHSLPDDQKTPARRRPIVEQYNKQGYTQEVIAMQLGVSQATITRDLGNLFSVNKLKHTKTASNPKGAGRPKGSKGHGTPKRHYQADDIVALADQGLSNAEIASETGVGKRQVRHVVERELAERAAVEHAAKAEPQVDRADLSLTAQQKFDAAITAYKRKLDSEYERRVNEGVNKHLDEMILPAWKKQLADARAIYHRRNGILKTKREYNLILGCLHPDSRLSVSDARLGEAFRLFNSLEKFLLDESQSPTEIGKGLPQTMAEWDRIRAAANAARKAKAR
jgi:transposase